MIYIATFAAVVIAIALMGISRALHEYLRYIEAHQDSGVRLVTLSQEDRDLITNFRRRGPNKPKAVKES